jgi:hypothetical protein
VKSSARSHNGIGEDRIRLAQIALDVGGDALVGAGQDRSGVGHDDRVVVDVDDPQFRRDALGDVVDVRCYGQAAPDIQELAHPGIARPNAADCAAT